MSERIRGSHDDALSKSTYTYLLTYLLTYCIFMYVCGTAAHVESLELDDGDEEDLVLRFAY